MFDEIAKFVTSKSIQDLSSFTWSSLQQGLKDMFTGIEEIADLMADVLNRDWMKLGSDIKKYEIDMPGRDNRSEALMGHHGYNDWGQSAEGKPLTDWQARRTQQAAPGAAKNGSWSPMTYFGPGVDPKGSPYYDPDSFNGRGHINGQLFDLNSPGAQPSAMHYDYATKHYGIKPGALYISDKDHKPHRWMDTSGAKNPENEDFYKGAQINYSPTYNISGDADHIIRTIKDNHHEVARHVHEAISDRLSRQAAV